MSEPTVGATFTAAVDGDVEAAVLSELSSAQQAREAAETQATTLQAEIDALRAEFGEDATAKARIDRLTQALRDARDKVVTLKEEIDNLSQPPSGFGVFVRHVEGDKVDVFTQGRKLRVSAGSIDPATLRCGQSVLLNEALNIVEALDFERNGEIVTFEAFLGDDRATVVGRTDDKMVVTLADSLDRSTLSEGDSLLVDPKSGFVFEKIPKTEVEGLLLEEVPDIDYEDIGGLAAQIEQIRDAVELPFLNTDLFREFELLPPKGILLYGPPGCGKTLIAKAVANALAKKVAELNGHSQRNSLFINVKGPELLNKYVGETERQIRLVFRRAREKASEGIPVIIFFDEMDAIFRTRGTGVSSDVENTIVPMLLAEIDGVEGLQNVIVIGASNRQDMIDPAILRSGRLDVKIKVERPDAEGARDIFSKYVRTSLPLHPEDLNYNGGSRDLTVDDMIVQVVASMYAENEGNRFLEVTYANGDKEILYFKDFNSGAMIRGIVDRAKKIAIKEFKAGATKGLRLAHLLAAVVEEFRENEDLPNTANPDDWARISGKKGEKIVNIRLLIQRDQKPVTETITNTGQYL